MIACASWLNNCANSHFVLSMHVHYFRKPINIFGKQCVPKVVPENIYKSNLRYCILIFLVSKPLEDNLPTKINVICI